MIDKDKRHLWHPFTQMQDWLRNDQLVIERGDGSYLYDTDGNKYIDGVSSLWVTVHGHRNKIINKAIKAQLDKVAHSTLLGLGNVPSIELAKELVKIVPKGLSKVFYSDDGSTAVEIALKIAFQSQQQTGQRKKTKFITLKNAYHGDTIGSVSVGGIDLFHKLYRPLLFKSIKVPAGDPKALEAVLKKRHHEIAAMIVEPLVQAAAGMLLQPKGYLKAVRRLCTKYNVLLIVDEVATGFGRTGKMFACEHEGVSPDLMCVAKGLTGGYLPVAATLTTEKIYKAFLGRPEENKAFFHGHTFTGNPLGCAAALASLQLFKQDKLLNKVGRSIKFLETALLDLYKLERVVEVRQLGLMVGIELGGYSAAERIGHRVILEARKRGAILRPLGDVIVLMPPLNIKRAELEKLLRVTYDSIRAVTER
ncbi:MAG: adenosylmethionine--8-amino-7-oxononanoate transaminase [Candidatus Margulisbacteria bacterium]|nr:adenosylmethionine--8-amino-7-oxononanoate transaminase [Candidatus Margulisiibacteriota bacterium]